MFSLYRNNNAIIDFTPNYAFILALLLEYVEERKRQIFILCVNFITHFQRWILHAITQVVSRGLFVVQDRVRSQNNVCGYDGRSGTGIVSSEPFFVSLPLTIPPMFHSHLRELSGLGATGPFEAQFQATITHI